jgi:hypothetical protein
MRAIVKIYLHDEHINATVREIPFQLFWFLDCYLKIFLFNAIIILQVNFSTSLSLTHFFMRLVGVRVSRAWERVGVRENECGKSNKINGKKCLMYVNFQLLSLSLTLLLTARRIIYWKFVTREFYILSNSAVRVFFRVYSRNVIAGDQRRV